MSLFLLICSSWWYFKRKHEHLFIWRIQKNSNHNKCSFSFRKGEYMIDFHMEKTAFLYHWSWTWETVLPFLKILIEEQSNNSNNSLAMSGRFKWRFIINLYKFFICWSIFMKFISNFKQLIKIYFSLQVKSSCFVIATICTHLISLHVM